MSVIVDTSVWVAHFRGGSSLLAELLKADQVLLHPMVLVEIACGTPPAPGQATLDYLAQLRRCKEAGYEEVVALIDRRRLYGKGCGLVDLCLLASALITPGAALWTLDKRLAALAADFVVGFPAQ